MRGIIRSRITRSAPQSERCSSASWPFRARRISWPSSAMTSPIVSRSVSSSSTTRMRLGPVIDVVGRGARQPDGEGGAIVRSGRSADAATVALDDLARDEEPEAHARYVLRVQATPKGLEHPVGRDVEADPLVGDTDDDAAIERLDSNHDRAGRARILQG